MITVRVQAEPFDIGAELALLRAHRTDIGALVSFTGLVRDVAMLTLDHYPAMALTQMRKLADTAEGRWPILAGTVIHRFGPLAKTEEIVLVAIASRHRAAAFESASFLMDWLKTRAPFWKREEGGNWVAARPEDDERATRWDQASH